MISKWLGLSITRSWAVAVAQLAKWLLPTPEIRSSNTNIGKIMKLRHHNDLHRVALEEAYQIAASKFRGRLEQNFIILKDSR